MALLDNSATDFDKHGDISKDARLPDSIKAVNADARSHSDAQESHARQTRRSRQSTRMDPLYVGSGRPVHSMRASKTTDRLGW